VVVAVAGQAAVAAEVVVASGVLAVAALAAVAPVAIGDGRNQLHNLTACKKCSALVFTIFKYKFMGTVLIGAIVGALAGLGIWFWQQQQKKNKGN
jgi:hypothetical protein